MRPTLFTVYLAALWMSLSSAAWSEFSVHLDSRSVHAYEDAELEHLVSCWLSQPKLEPIADVIASGRCSLSSEERPLYLWSIAKRALIWGLRHHTDTLVKKLPKKWRAPVKKYAGKVANLLETFENWKEGACIVGLSGMGIPPADAIMICQALSFLL